jgi:hypothetical protein
MSHISAETTAVTSTIDNRLENFIQAYRQIGYSNDAAASLGKQRLRQDNKAVFEVEGCSNYRTAKELVWLLEAAHLLCCGDLYQDDAIELIEKALEGLEACK